MTGEDWIGTCEISLGEAVQQSMQHHTLQARGLTFHGVTAGPEHGPPVFLLHGFPDFWYGWRHQIVPLANAGYRVIVPDQRGYGESSKPARVAEYALDQMSDDVVAIADALGIGSFHVVGHDWGGGVAWRVACQHAERVRSLATLNCPHPLDLMTAAMSDRRQFFKSWYMLFFQLPWLPEWALRRKRFAALAGGTWGSADPGAFTKADKAAYREAWAQPGAVRGMLGWYRALRHRPAPWRTLEIAVPTLMMFGERDTFIDVSTGERSLSRCLDGRFERVDATHWIQHDRPGLVSDRLVKWLSDPTRA